MTTMFPPTGLTDQLSALITQKRQELLRLINCEVLTLFWNIGVTYNQEVKPAAAELDTVSHRLTDHYGPLLAKNSLKQMGQFAEKFPDFSGMANDAACISWEHHLALLPVTAREAWDFYVRLALEQGLDVNDLRQKIEERTFERTAALSRESKKLNRSKSKPHLPVWALAINQQRETLITDFFEGPLLLALSLLTEPARLPETNLDDAENELLALFLQDINAFGKQVNKRLNVELNKFFWTIGKRIDDELTASGYANNATLIASLAAKLGSVYGENFNTESLLQMLGSAQQFSESRVFTRVAYLVNWDHITVLMQLPTLTERLFYARIAALQGLSVTALQQAINQSLYEQTIGAEEREQQAIATMQSATTSKSVKKQRNKTTIITTTMVSYGEDIHNSLAVGNMFKNKQLLNFIG